MGQPPSVRRRQAENDLRSASVVADYFAGDSVTDIAEKHGLRRETVSRIVNRARERWQAEAARQYENELPKRMAELEKIKAAAWKSWEESSGIITDSMEEETDTGDGPPTTKKRKNRKRKAGNAAYLGQMIKAIHLQSQMMGLITGKGDAAEANDDAKPKYLEVIIESTAQRITFDELMESLPVEQKQAEPLGLPEPRNVEEDQAETTDN